jgi:hypothetical protein
MSSVESENDVTEWCQWLKVNSDPMGRVIELWLKTAKSRLSFIHLHQPLPTLNDIISEWPRYTDEKGYVLVSSTCDRLVSFGKKFQFCKGTNWK